jgi:hypothetical protein
MKLLIACGSLALGACAMSAGMSQSTQHVVTPGGENYLISQLTAGTWTATSVGVARQLATGADSKASMLYAIEQTSGCKVTDSYYTRQGLQLDAQVDCGDRIKN